VGRVGRVERVERVERVKILVEQQKHIEVVLRGGWALHLLAFASMLALLVDVRRPWTWYALVGTFEVSVDESCCRGCLFGCLIVLFGCFVFADFLNQ
jgi:formate-dependent nitrite reductase membrane component NrfD